MNRVCALASIAFVCSLSGLAAAGRAGASGPRPAPPRSAAETCFAPGTDPVVVEEHARFLAAQDRERFAGSLASPMAEVEDDDRWSATATDGPGLSQGDPTILTWGVVPDGTPIDGWNGEAAAPSNLRAFLNSIYRSESNWRPLFQRVFDRWSEITGVIFVHEPADDAAPLVHADGQRNVRADVRIGGHRIDGDYTILAYNFYPDIGDMIIDTDEEFFRDTSQDSLGLRNMLAHELGHGLGFSHTCPLDQTKLMEPILSRAYDGPQHDEIYGGTRLYGDPLEHNDAATDAADLGSLGNGTVLLRNASVDDDADIDYFVFAVGPGKRASVTVSPVGASYRVGGQNQDRSCGAGEPFSTRAQNDVAVQILDRDGVGVLATADVNPAGTGESLIDVALPSGAGTYFLRVSPGGADAAQLYTLSLKIDDAPAPPNPFGLENPPPNSFQSGIGLVSGWICNAERVTFRIDDGAPRDAAYGTSRADTAAICGDSNNGFGALLNWNLLGDGLHRIRVFADGLERGSATFRVTTLGVPFLHGAVGQYELPNFPVAGKSVLLRWQEGSQNFVLADAGSRVVTPLGEKKAQASILGALENPAPETFQSGVGVISGWVCDAGEITLRIDGGAPVPAGYGTSRGDTAAICGDTNNGFGRLLNWNLLGDGVHTIASFADGQKFGEATFSVKTLGSTFLRGITAQFVLADFAGKDVLVSWQEAQQNFVIVGKE